MTSPERYRVLALSAAKHEYVALAFRNHPRFQVVGVADEPTAADWVHERNEQLAADLGVAYQPDVDAAITEHRPHIGVVSSEAARHARLSVRSAEAGLHVVQDKPMAPTIADCDAIVEAVERAGVQFLLWNRNTQPAIEEARRVVHAGEIGEPRAIHVDFFFSKDAGVLLDSDEDEEIPDSWLSEGELTVEGIYPLAYMRHILGLDALRGGGRRHGFPGTGARRHRFALHRSHRTPQPSQCGRTAGPRGRLHRRPGDCGTAPGSRRVHAWADARGRPQPTDGRGN